jgi:hypothetical protein
VGNPVRLGDLDGDGLSELAVGVAGAHHLLSGADHGLEPESRPVLPLDEDRSRLPILVPLDVDGDGRLEVLATDRDHGVAIVDGPDLAAGGIQISEAVDRLDLEAAELPTDAFHQATTGV